MPSIFSHIAAPLAIKFDLRNSRLISTRLLVLAMICCVLPDLDVLAFKFGIPYESQWGHRGFTHSIGFAVLAGVVASFYSRYLNSHRLSVFLVIFFVTASHALLDSATNGGLGCALLWPFSNERYFLPWTPIQVSPIGIEGFLSERGIAVLESELVWVWLPSAMLTAIIFICEAIVMALIIALRRHKKRAIETQS